MISGEVPRTQTPPNFFSIFVKFQRACQVNFSLSRNDSFKLSLILFQQARHDNEERKRLAREAAATLERPPKRAMNKRSQVCWNFPLVSFSFFSLINELFSCINAGEWLCDIPGNREMLVVSNFYLYVLINNKKPRFFLLSRVLEFARMNKRELFPFFLSGRIIK